MQGVGEGIDLIRYQGDLLLSPKVPAQNEPKPQNVKLSLSSSTGQPISSKPWEVHTHSAHGRRRRRLARRSVRSCRNSLAEAEVPRVEIFRFSACVAFMDLLIDGESLLN